ncbi:DUF4249 domain-containing protein [Foetidibacter luteolus]|uniref:DUF4249 domain-containing protein n=1 Tax=Foetidibacter luteolus TaxID=2608880 RepID=UPI00129B05C5|nr:DUF4249 domain-containing protein [Foetidibacter luteolus]
MINCKQISRLLGTLLLLAACKERYDPPNISPATGYLVVEGFINSGAATSTVITLSRTVKLEETQVVHEAGAAVNIESENGETYPLQPGVSGQYSSQPLTLNPASRYRLRIITSDGKEYLSSYTPVKTGPPIDSITWKREEGGVQIYVNAHDEQNNTRFYQWKFEETWEFYSSFSSSLIYTKDQLGRPVGVAYRYPDHSINDSIYQCWNTIYSSNILLGSTEKLVTDVVYLPMRFIEPASVKLSSLYSIKLKQYALSREAYQFMQKMKKNTEQLGSVFDPQPSELRGNIENINDPSEVVVGFVDVTEEKEKRIFIYNREVPGWGYNAGCRQEEIDNHPDSIAKYGAGLLPATPNKMGLFGAILTFYASDPVCIDCTMRGTNVKPDFWP